MNMLTLIGCGNPNRSDDGVGVRVAQRLRERLEKYPIAGVQVFDCGTGGMEVMFAARGSDSLVVLDACQSGSAPGTIYDVPGTELEAVHEGSYSLHDFRWDHALFAGRKIFGDSFPSEVRVWLVEAESVGLGLEMSPSVCGAADILFQRCLDHIAQYAAGRHDDVRPMTLEIRRGSIQLPAALYDRYFGGRDGALLLTREDDLCVMPVESVAGGLMVKQRNSRGDRSVDASEFLRKMDWPTERAMCCASHWDAELGALVLKPAEVGELKT